MHIASVEKQPLTTTGSPLLIRCKTFLSVTFVIAKERECHDVYTTLIKLCQPGKGFFWKLFIHKEFFELHKIFNKINNSSILFISSKQNFTTNSFDLKEKFSIHVDIKEKNYSSMK